MGDLRWPLRRMGAIVLCPMGKGVCCLQPHARPALLLQAGTRYERTLEAVSSNTPCHYGRSPAQNQGCRRGRIGMDVQCFDLYSWPCSPEPVLSRAWFSAGVRVMPGVLITP